MRILKLLVLLTALSSFGVRADNQPNGLITGNAGTRFTLLYDSNKGVLVHTVDGLVQLSNFGNCIIHFDVTLPPSAPGQPLTGEGTGYFLSPKDGSTLKLKGRARAVPEPNTPFANFHYDIEIVSGDGVFAGARGQAIIDGAAMFINAEGSEGTATWLFRGHLFTHGK